MVTPRSAIEPGDRLLLPAPRLTREMLDDRAAELARRWAGMAPGVNPGLPGRLRALLRRLAAIVHAEPYGPKAARALGVDLVGSGLLGAADAPATEIQENLSACLALLRTEAPTVLGVSGGDDERRLAGTLDELCVGAVGAIAARARKGAQEGLPGVRRAWNERAMFDQAAFGIGIISLDGTAMMGNPALTAIFGTEVGTEPRPMADYVHPDDLPEVMRFHERLVTGGVEVVRTDIRVVRPDEQMLWVHVVGSLVRLPDGSPSHVLVLVEDVSSRRVRNSRLQSASSRDQLTRLPGQAQVDQWLARAFDEGSAASEVAICTVALDGFPVAMSGDQGDRLLLAVAGRLQMSAREHVLARTGATEFTVLISEPTTSDEPVRVADRLLDALTMPFLIDDRPVVLSGSVGVAQGSTTGGSASERELRRGADIAVSWARSQGGGRRVVFDPQRDADEAARFTLLSGMRGAIERGEFRLLYQPLVGLDDRRMRGAEALVRWQHPDEGLLGPGRFIGLAEQSGAIVPLGRWVLEEACEQAAAWSAELGAAAPYVSVNVSPVQLAAPTWVDEVIEVLATTGLPPAKLQLEITEQAVLGDEVGAMASLAALGEVGVRLALDDFGTGYSSFGWLRRLPVHALKLDGSFIDGLRHVSPNLVDRSIVRAVIDMAHALGLEVTAEWVETALQARRLSMLGCDVGQGRWFGDPGPGRFVPGLSRRRMGS